MEPLTHLAAGLLTSQALRPVLFPRRLFAPASATGRGLAVLCAVAATIPDIDSLASLAGPESYLLHHRGLTHSLFALPLVALLLAWAARSLGAGIPLRQGFAAAGLALGTHLFLDVMTAFGTQLFAPFSNLRVSFEGVYIVDPAFLLALFGFSLAARLRPQRSRTLALWGLTFMLAYPLACNGLRLHTQSRFEALLRDRGQSVDQVSLLTDALSPYYWKVVLASGPDLHVTTTTPFDLAASYPVLHLKRVDRAELMRLGETASIFRTYAWFAEHPAEYPAQLSPDYNERRFVDAAFVHSGPVLARLFGQGTSFAECDALFDAAGRLIAWRDWKGETHPAAEAAGGPASAQAGQTLQPSAAPAALAPPAPAPERPAS